MKRFSSITIVLTILIGGQARADIWDYARPASAYILQPSAYEATICRETEGETILALTVRGFDYEVTVKDDQARTDHCFSVSDLMPESRYTYSFDDDLTSGTKTFYTSPAHFRPFRFAVYGDTRDGHDIHNNVIDVIEEMNPAFVIHTGDFVHDGDVLEEWHLYFQAADRLIERVPLLPVFGNHENRNGSLFHTFFPIENPGEQGTGHYYHLDVLDCRFIVIDSETDYQPGSSQYEWLSALLAETAEDPTIIHTFAAFHRPSYTSGYHNDDSLPLAEVLPPLFEEFGVEVVFNGHDHDYERSYRNGVTYIVAGGGGAPYFPLDQPEFIPLPEANPFREIFLGIFHAVSVEVFLSSIHFVVHDQFGQIQDDFWIGDPVDEPVYPDDLIQPIDPGIDKTKGRVDDFMLCSQTNGSFSAMFLFLLTIFSPYIIVSISRSKFFSAIGR